MPQGTPKAVNAKGSEMNETASEAGLDNQPTKADCRMYRADLAGDAADFRIGVS